MSVADRTNQQLTIDRPPTGGGRVWATPLAVGLGSAVLWSAAGYPWWPPALVCALLVLTRLLGLAARVAAPRRATLITGLLAATTAWSISPWLAIGIIALGAAAWALLRAPRRLWVCVVGAAVAAGSGLGWALDSAVTARRTAAEYEQTRAFNRAQLLPRDPRHVLGEVMALVADNDPGTACALFAPSAQQQLAAAYRAPDCAAAVYAWHSRVTRPNDYRLSPQLHGEQATEDRGGQTATLVACGLRWTSSITGPRPAAGPDSPGRMQLRRVLGQGFEITDFTSC